MFQLQTGVEIHRVYEEKRDEKRAQLIAKAIGGMFGG